MRYTRIRRGLFADRPSSLEYGEVYICTDSTQVFCGDINKEPFEIRDKAVLEEIKNIKADIVAKDTHLKSEIAKTNQTVEANKQDANKKIADLTQKVNENQQGSNASLEALEQKVDNNKNTTDQTIANLEKKVDGNKTSTDTTISALTEKVNANKSDADSKYNSNLEKINANKQTADANYNSNLQKINANKQDADSKYNANLEKINQNKTYGENTYVKRAEYLTGNQDFNNLITPGAYFLVGAVHTNKPSSLQSGKGGFLQVSKFVSQGNTTVIQVFTDEVSGVTYSRVKTYSENNTSWTEWNTHYSMNSKPTPGDINSYTKQEIDNKDTATLNSAKAYTYSKAEIDSKDTTTLNSAKSYADTKKNEAVTFATTELAKKLNLTGGALTGTLSFDRDDLGLVFYQNAKVYKKSGSGLTLAPHNDDFGVSIEDTQGNLIMRIAKNSPLTYRGNAVYHAGNKPTPNDIGAYNKSEVDNKDTTTLNNAKAYADEKFIEKTPTRLDSKDLNTILNPGRYVCVNCTNAPNTYGRMDVLVWNSSAKWVTQVFYSDVNNKLYTRCSTNETATTWTPWAEMYSTSNKPSWNDIQNKPSTFAPSSHNHDSSYLGINATAKNSEKLFGYGQYIGRNQGGTFGIPVVGSDGVMETGAIIDMHLNNSTKDYDGRLQINGDGTRLVFNSNTIYTTGNKPTPSDIGAFGGMGAKPTGAGTDLNTLTANGAYEIQEISKCANGITGSVVYDWGVVVVFNSIKESGTRITQVYYPHMALNGRRIPYFRVKDNTTWSSWSPVVQGVGWGEVTGKPNTFPPSTHNHDSLYLGKTAKAESAKNADTVGGKTFAWEYGSGNPTHIWGTNQGDKALMQVWDPKNITVGRATNANSADSVAWGNVSGRPSYLKDLLVDCFGGENDLNTYNPTGIWVGRTINNTTNRPGDWMTVINFGANGNCNGQLAWNYDNSELDLKFRKRHDSSGNYGSWRTIYHEGKKPTPAEIGAVATSNVSNTYSNNTVVQRNEDGDISARLLRASYQDDTYINGAIAFRTNNTTDNYTRYCNSPDAVRNWLGASPSDHNHDGRYLPLVNGSTGESYRFSKSWIEVGTDSTKIAELGVGSTDVYVHNTKSNKYLALKDDGRILYDGKNVLTDIQGTPLWQGYHHMSKSEKVTPSKPLSQCNNGWVIVWSDWDDGTQGRDWNVCYSHIPKNTIFKTGQNTTLPLAAGESSWAIKTLYIYDSYFTGNDTNKTGDNYDVVIRAVLEY